MRFECKTKIEKTWLVASVLIFVTHQLLEVSVPGHYNAAGALRLWLEVAMVALSFPLGGMALFVIQNVAYWCDGCRDLEFMVDWSTLLFAGYIQWFWVLPEFLRGRKLSLLNLTRLPEIISSNASPADHEAPPASLAAAPPFSFVAPPPAATTAAVPIDDCDDAPLPAFDAAAFTPTLAEFDAAGLTALDRVFQAASSPPAHASPSHVEAIFPQVN